MYFCFINNFRRFRYNIEIFFRILNLEKYMRQRNFENFIDSFKSCFISFYLFLLSSLILKKNRLFFKHPFLILLHPSHSETCDIACIPLKSKRFFLKQLRMQVGVLTPRRSNTYCVSEKIWKIQGVQSNLSTSFKSVKQPFTSKVSRNN